MIDWGTLLQVIGLLGALGVWLGSVAVYKNKTDNQATQIKQHENEINWLKLAVAEDKKDIAVLESKSEGHVTAVNELKASMKQMEERIVQTVQNLFEAYRKSE